MPDHASWLSAYWLHNKGWWRHQMETLSALLALCAGNSPDTGEFPTQRPVTQSFDVFLICAWINGWVNNREIVDLRRHRAHNDVIIMWNWSVVSQEWNGVVGNYICTRLFCPLLYYIHIHFKVSQWTNVICLRISYRIVLRALGQSSECLNKMKHILPKDGM